MKGGEERLLQPSQNRDQNDNNEEMVHPLQIVGRAGSRQLPMGNLPSTMRHNSDGTASIFTPVNDNSGDFELFTEIPFFAFHGMQTRARDECDIIGTYADTFNDVWEGDSTRKLTVSLVIATITTATLQFLAGYNVVILNTPEKYVFPGHRTIHWSMAVGEYIRFNLPSHFRTF
jgi:hypothetical protein